MAVRRCCYCKQTGQVTLDGVSAIEADGGDDYLDSSVTFEIGEESGGQR